MKRLAVIGAALLAMVYAAGCGLRAPTSADRLAVTYYVDFDGGSDARAGTSAAAAFRRAPGDPAATGRAADVVLRPGDIVIFKGGVHYRGSVVLAASGAEGRPITLDGNTAGAFGEGPAVFDGADRITVWHRCRSAADAGGNPHWAKIYRAEAPAGATALASNLNQDGRLLILAQYPNPSDPMFTDNTGEYLSVPAATDGARTRITDPRLAEIGGDRLIGAYAYVWRRTNQIDTRTIRAFDAASGTITIDRLGGRTYPRIRYAIANSTAPAVFDRPGEYVFVESADGGEPVIYLWPLDDQDPSTAVITVAVRPLAVSLTGRNDFITVQGLKIQNYRRAIFRSDGLGRARCIVIRDNEVTRIKAGDYANAIELYDTDALVVAGNYLHDCPKMRGIIAHGGVGASIRNNRLVRMGRTPIVMYGMTGGELVSNTVTHCRGMHSNGMSVYLNNRDILIEGNRIFDANIPLTVSSTVNLTIRNNIFDGAGRAQPISFWENVDGRVVVENNILIGGRQGSGLCLTGLGDRTGETFQLELIVRNNIMDGPPMNIMVGEPWLKRIEHTGNIYMAAPAGYKLGADERIIDDVRTVLPGVDRQDYRRAEGVTAGPRGD